MAAKKPTKAAYLKEIDRLTPHMRLRYLVWVQERVNLASVSAVERWVRTANVDEIIRELGITPASLANVTEQVRTAYMAGGQFEATAFPAAAKFTFDIRNPGAELWLGRESSRLVTDITASQTEVIRESLERGVIRGANPRTTALDIIGRVDSTGRRRGGVIGLSHNQATAVSNMKDELLSGDPATMSNYFNRLRRDKRFDGVVRRAIEQRTPVSINNVNKMAGRYSDRLLQLRGETIARTETIAAFNAARDQAWEQAVDEGTVEREFILSIWSSTGGPRTRDTHLAMNNQKRKQGEAFDSPSGAQLRYPGDTSLGAPPSETINCRCYNTKRVDFIGQAAAREARSG